MLDFLRQRLQARGDPPASAADKPEAEVYRIRRAILDVQAQIAEAEDAKLHFLGQRTSCDVNLVLDRGDAWESDEAAVWHSKIDETEQELTRLRALVPTLETELAAAEREAERHRRQQERQAIGALITQHAALTAELTRRWQALLPQIGQLARLEAEIVERRRAWQADTAHGIPWAPSQWTTQASRQLSTIWQPGGR